MFNLFILMVQNKTTITMYTVFLMIDIRIPTFTQLANVFDFEINNTTIEKKTLYKYEYLENDTKLISSSNHLLLFLYRKVFYPPMHIKKRSKVEDDYGKCCEEKMRGIWMSVC